MLGKQKTDTTVQVIAKRQFRPYTQRLNNSPTPTATLVSIASIRKNYSVSPLIYFGVCMILRFTLLGAALTIANIAVAQSNVGPAGMRMMQATPPPAPGYLCCNMRTDGKWIDDINYADSGQTVVPAGTPVKPIEVIGPHRLLLDIGGGQKTLGNQYSRTLSIEDFAKRYIVPEDPTKNLGAYPDRIRAAINSAKITIGMTRAQVIMSIGYPVTTENPDPTSNTWRYWRSSFSEYRVQFDDNGKVAKVEGDPAALKQVVYE